MKKAIIFLSLISPAFATTTIERIETTPQQALVHVLTDQTPSTCVIHASLGAALSTDVADIADNGTTTARVGTLVDGKHVTFEIGQRRGSYSLAASNAYTAGVTCGSDSQVTQTFQTKPVPWGNLAPCDVPFNASKPFFADWPDLDFNPADSGKMYADTCTGMEYYLHSPFGVNSPNWIPASTSTVQAGTDVSGGGTWTNLGNTGSTSCTPGPSGTCPHSTAGGPSDKLFVPVGSFTTVQSSFNVGLFSNIDHVDDYVLDVYCQSATGETLTIQLSVDHGQTVVGNAKTVTCPATFGKAGSVPSSDAPNPPFLDWGYIPMHNQTSAVTGGATSNGPVITSTGNLFYTNGEMGPKIRINGTEYNIVSVDSPTQITIDTDLGVQSGLSWKTTETGFVISKSGTGDIDVALGLNVATSRGEHWGQNADWPQVNDAPVTVSFAADGTTPITPTKGYLAFEGDGNSADSGLYLWVPFNGDGTVRNEIRPLSSLQFSKTAAHVTLNGDTGTGSTIELYANDSPGTTFSGDADDATSAYLSQIGGGGRIWKATYTSDPSRTASFAAGSPPCVNFPAYNSQIHGMYRLVGTTPNPARDCFDYFDMTPTTSVTLIRNAYTNRPDLQKLTWIGGNSLIGVRHKKAVVQIWSGQEDIALIGILDLSGTVATVTQVYDTFSGNATDSVGRWAAIHSCASISQDYVFCAFNKILGAGSSAPLEGSWRMPIARISRAGFGSPDAWGTNTALTQGQAYKCPDDGSITPEYANVAGTNSCFKAEFSEPPCSSTPYTGTNYFGGLTEKQAFPCSTPDGNGGTLGIANPNKSKLQDLRAGDCFDDLSNPRGELLCVVTPPQYIGVNQIQAWVSRWNRWRYITLVFGDTNVSDLNYTHTTGWTAEMTPSYSSNGSEQGQAVLVPVNGGDLRYFGAGSGCHAITSPYGDSGNVSFMVEGCGPFQAALNVDLPSLGRSIVPTFGKGDNFQTMSFGFAGTPQSYPALEDASKEPVAIGSDYHAMLVGNGNITSDGLTSLWNTNPTLVDGTLHTYRISVQPVTPGTAVYKRQPYIGHAGRFVLRDVSGTGPYTGDMPDYSFCIALHAGECYATSTVGQVFTTVPSAYTGNGCYIAQFSYPAPCVFPMIPHLGTENIYRIDTKTGFPIHKVVGIPHVVPGAAYAYSNCRFATKDFLFCIAQFADGRYTSDIAYHIRPELGFDGIDHSRFIPTTINVTGVPWATYARARFGYLENGTNPATNTFRCTNYAADCSTDPPASSSEWYSFVTSWDVGTRTACTAGSQCPMTMDLISGRVAYYVIDRLAADGTVLSTSAPRAIATP